METTKKELNAQRTRATEAEVSLAELTATAKGYENDIKELKVQMEVEENKQMELKQQLKEANDKMEEVHNDHSETRKKLDDQSMEHKIAGKRQVRMIKDLSMEPICRYLKKKINQNIHLIKTNINHHIEKNLFDNKNILMFENLRFYNGEEENNEEFAKILASFGDLYVNDAFSCSHRSHSSVEGITKHIPSYYGLQITQEIQALKKITSEIKKPVTLIIGGSKISTKINVIINLIKNVNNIIIVGAMANNFLTFKGFIVGKSLTEKNTTAVIKKIYLEAKKHNCNIFTPEDCCVSTDFKGSGKTKELNSISKEEMILDIGPKTVKNIENIIDQSNTVLWNGPAGYFENKNFLIGTSTIAKKISENTEKKSLISVIGGGDTIAAINASKDKFFFTHLSTAGGAFLEFLEGKDLPGLNVLK